MHLVTRPKRGRKSWRFYVGPFLKMVVFQVLFCVRGGNKRRAGPKRTFTHDFCTHVEFSGQQSLKPMTIDVHGRICSGFRSIHGPKPMKPRSDAIEISEHRWPKADDVHGLMYCVRHAANTSIFGVQMSTRPQHLRTHASLTLRKLVGDQQGRCACASGHFVLQLLSFRSFAVLFRTLP